jgi:serine phosphatase RsbU (regulator of sigma subunit)
LKKNIIIIVLLFLFFRTIATERVVTITSDKQFYNLSANTYFLVDSNNSVSIDNIISDNCPLVFTRNTLTEIHNDHSYLSYWYKINIENKFQINKNMVLVFANSTIPLLRVYVKRKNYLSEYRPTGNQLPFNTRDIDKANFCFQLNLLPFEKQTIYVQIQPKGDALNTPIELYDAVTFTNKSNNESLVNGIYYGLMLITIIISLILIISFTSINETTNVVYLGILFFFALWNANIDGLAFQYLWPTNPYISNICMYTLPLIGIIFLSLFADKTQEKRFLSVMMYTIKLIFSLIIIIFIVYTLCIHLPLVFIHAISLFLGSIMLLFTFITWYIQIQNQPRSAKYYISLIITILAWLIIITLKIFTKILPYEFYNVIFKLFLGIQAFILTLTVISNMRIKYTETYNQTLSYLDQQVNVKNVEIDNKSREISTIHNDITKVTLLLEKQNKDLQYKNDKIQYETNYARNIQQALLPNAALLKKTLKQVFIYHKPKFELSSDIYFIQQINEILFVAVIDCSSNGIAGTLLSTMVSHYLEIIVLEKGIRDTDKIVTMLQSKINELFTHNKNDFFNSESIDIGLITIDCRTNVLNYTGTKIAALIVNTKGAIEIKGDTNSLGDINSKREYNFITNQYNLLIGDVVYLCTNGYTNQCNSDSIRFMKKNLQTILIDLHTESASVQKLELEKHLTNWKGNCDQTDDILIVGIKI